MRDLILAFRFLTVFPLGWIRLADPALSVGPEAEAGQDGLRLERAMAYFPVVGAVQGALMVLTLRISMLAVPVSVASALALIVLTLTNFGFHLDGFADTLDGLAGGSTKERRLSIMRKSDIGPVGVTGLMLLLITKYSALSALVKMGAFEMVFLFPIVARWSMVPMSYFADYARGDNAGLGRAFSRVNTKTLAVASALCAIPMFILIGPVAILLLFLIFVLVALVTLYFKRKIGGVTGDVFGFQSEITEVAFLILAIVALNLGGQW